MNIFTGSAPVNRGRVSLLLHALLQSSLGLRSHGPEIGPRPRQGRSPQDPLVRQRRPVWMKKWWTCLVSWEEEEPRDRGHRTFVIDITVFFYCLYCYWHYCFLLLSILLLTLLFSVIVYMVTNTAILIFCVCCWIGWLRDWWYAWFCSWFQYRYLYFLVFIFLMYHMRSSLIWRWYLISFQY